MYYQRRKYNNIPKVYSGKLYQSSLEGRYAQTLNLLKKAGEIKGWKPQQRYRLEVNGTHICDIIPDFYVIGKYGREEIHETKSWATQTPEWRIKWKLMKVLYPEFYYKVVTNKDF